jgi:hypothetical protein
VRGYERPTLIKVGSFANLTGRPAHGYNDLLALPGAHGAAARQSRHAADTDGQMGACEPARPAILTLTTTERHDRRERSRDPPMLRGTAFGVDRRRIR